MAIGFVLMTTHPGKEAMVREALNNVDLVTDHWMLFGEYDLIARVQADEEYGAKVWDKHFGELEEHLLRQDASVGKFSFLNPFQATDRLSMAIAGTGLNSHLEFLRQTEYYRRELVRRLNEEDAFGVARSENGRELINSGNQKHNKESLHG